MVHTQDQKLVTLLILIFVLRVMDTQLLLNVASLAMSGLLSTLWSPEHVD